MAIKRERSDLYRGALVLAISLLIPFVGLRAETLPELVQYLTQEHNLVKAAENDVNAARQRARVALGDWFPNLDVSTSYGFEDQIQPGADDTRFVTRDLDLKVTQLLWDFGKTNAALRKAGLVLEQSLAVLDGVRQNVLLRGVTAYLNVARRTQVLKFAKRSEENIKKQANLEDALVQAGKGFSTDVLQAKARLAGAEARRIDAQGRFEVAKNDYRALFESAPDDIYSQGIVHLPYESLPLTLGDAVETAFKFNPSLKSETFGIQIAEEDINSTRSDSFFPRIQGVIEQRYKKDFSGSVGFQRETLGKVELSFPFNLGLTSVNKLRAARHDRSATVHRVADRKDIVEQQTRDAWINFQTARQRTTSLRNQAEIVMRFLEDARKERKAGRRSLLDVLDGETQLLNAQSDAASAEVDSAIAIFTLFEAMGQLKDSIILGRKSGEYQLKPRLNLDLGKRRSGAAGTKAMRENAAPSIKDSGNVPRQIQPKQTDEESKVEARLRAYKKTVSDLVASQREVEPSPEADSADLKLSVSVQTAVLQDKNEIEATPSSTADSESPLSDLLADIGRFFESAADPEKTIDSKLVEVLTAEAKTPPETSPETNIASEMESNLTSDSAYASPVPDQLPESDSGLSGLEQTAALEDENEIEAVPSATADSESPLYDLLADIGRLFESAAGPGDSKSVEVAAAPTMAEPIDEAKTPTQFSEILETEEPDTELNLVRSESAETATITTTEPPFTEFESAVYDLLARIGQFFVSANDAGEPDESVLVGTGVAEFKAPPKTLD